jgi:quercetin dioxygenase-like cupin family protein
MVEEARLEEVDSGLAPVTDGWFVVNVRDAAWLRNEAFGARCVFEGDKPVLRRRPDLPVHKFAEVGFTLQVVHPGQPSGMYHAESNQEGFLVLAGECLLLVEGEERLLHAWDFVHCPPGTEHIFVGAGDGPCVIFAAGARTEPGPGREQPPGTIVYPYSELARRHDAGVETETTSPPDAYAPFPKWQPGRPDDWNGLPWT